MNKNTTSEKKRQKLNETIQDIINFSSVVHFYFKETGVVLYNRDELYGIMDLIGKLIIYEPCSLYIHLVMVYLAISYTLVIGALEWFITTCLYKLQSKYTLIS